MTPRIVYSDLTKKFYITTRYTEKDGHLIAHTKYDATWQIDEIVRPIADERDMLLQAAEDLIEHTPVDEIVISGNATGPWNRLVDAVAKVRRA